MKKVIVASLIGLAIFVTGCHRSNSKDVTEDLFVTDIEESRSYFYTSPDNPDGINCTITLANDNNMKFVTHEVPIYNKVKDKLHDKIKCKLKITYNKNNVNYKLIEVEGVDTEWKKSQ